MSIEEKLLRWKKDLDNTKTDINKKEGEKEALLKTLAKELKVKGNESTIIKKAESEIKRLGKEYAELESELGELVEEIGDELEEYE